MPARVLRTAGGERRVGPAGRDQPLAHEARREVGDADDVDAGRAPRLREIERPEDAAADDRHADRAPGGRAFLEPSQERPRLHAGIIARRAARRVPLGVRRAPRAPDPELCSAQSPALYCASMRSSSASSPWRIGPLNQRWADRTHQPPKSTNAPPTVSGA